MEVKLKNRLELAKYFAALGFTKGAEIGVLGGHYSEILLNTIPNLFLIGVDNWKNISNAKQTMDKYYAKFDKKVTIIPKHSMDALEAVPDESLDFVYIDANHQYHAVLDDITGWAKKVRKGGIVAGDDYFDIPASKWGVVRAVNDYKPVHYSTDWDFSLGIEDTHPQWFFFKGGKKMVVL